MLAPCVAAGRDERPAVDDERVMETSAGRRVRVAVVIDTAPPWSKGGRERRYAELLARVSGELDVTVYTMRWWDGRPPRGPIRYVAVCPRVALYRHGRRSILQGVLFALGTLRVAFGRFDVLYADHMPYLQLFPLRLVAWLRRAPLVAEWHEHWSTAYWREYLGAAGVVASAVQRVSQRLPDRIVPVSDALADELADAGVDRHRMRVIPNGVDRRGLDGVVAAGDAPDVLVVGRLLEHKRPDLALRAFAAVHARRDGVRLGIVGDGPLRGDLERQADELGVAGNVEFYGRIEEDQRVSELVRGTRVLLSLSEREGFGLIVAESLALGTPVVTVDAPDNHAARLVEDDRTGTVVPTGDVDAATRAVERWLDRDVRDGVRDTFWTGHPELDWDASADAYVQLITSAATHWTPPTTPA